MTSAKTTDGPKAPNHPATHAATAAFSATRPATRDPGQLPHTAVDQGDRVVPSRPQSPGDHDATDVPAPLPPLPPLRRGRLTRQIAIDKMYGVAPCIHTVPPRHATQAQATRTDFEDVIRDDLFNTRRDLESLWCHLGDRALLEICRALPDSARVVDYGCGQGYLVSQLASPRARVELLQRQRSSLNDSQAPAHSDQAAQDRRDRTRGYMTMMQVHEALADKHVHGTAITAAIRPESKKALIREGIDVRADVLERQVPEASRPGKFDLAVDMVGISAYTPDLSQYLNSVLRTLDVGGAFVLVQASGDVTVDGMSLHDYLAQRVPGIERVDSGWQWSVYRKTEALPSFVPPMEIQPGGYGREFMTLPTSAVAEKLDSLCSVRGSASASAPQTGCVLAAALDEVKRTGNVELLRHAAEAARRSALMTSSPHEQPMETALNLRALACTLDGFAQLAPEQGFGRIAADLYKTAMQLGTLPTEYPLVEPRGAWESARPRRPDRVAAMRRAQGAVCTPLER